MASHSNKDKHVPKFGSFRRKQPSDAIERTPVIRSADAREAKQSVTRSDEYISAKQSTGSSSSRRALAQPPTSERKEVSPHKSFTLDLAGDVNNVKYSSLHKYHVPPYRRSGFGAILGLRPEERIDRDLSTDNSIVTITAASKNTSALRLHRPRLNTSHAQLIQPQSPAKTSRMGLSEYISLEPDQKRKRHRPNETTDEKFTLQGEELSSSSDESENNVDDDLRSHSKVNPETDATINNGLPSFLKERAALSEQVRLQPGSGELWLKLIDHYDQQALGHHSHGYQDMGSAETSAMTEIKLSLIAKALESVDEDRYRQLLLRMRMREVSHFWDFVKASNMWKDALSKNSNYALLWTDHLDFLQTRSSPYSVSDIKDAYAATCQRLRSLEPLSEMFYRDIMCYILLRLTTFLREAGYIELAVAIWQANLEFHALQVSIRNSFPDKRMSEDELIASYESYWESETPRLGEENWKGWGSNDPHNITANAGADVSLISNAPLGLREWAVAERNATQSCYMPARSIDDLSQDDPYRVVMFSDILPFLISARNSRLNLTPELIIAFQSFCDIPPSASTNSAFSWWQDPFLRAPFLQDLEIQRMTPTIAGPFRTPCPSFVMDTAVAFSDGKTWFTALHGQSMSSTTSWPISVLRQLVDHSHGTIELQEHLVALTATTSDVAARKLAKSMVKRTPTNLALYNAYASLFVRMRQLDSAEEIFSTVLRISKNLEDVLMILVSRTWNFIANGMYQQARSSITSWFENETSLRSQPPKVHIASQAQQSLTEVRDRLLNTSNYTKAMHVVELLMLEEYLRSSEQLMPALKNFQESIALWPDSEATLADREKLHQSRARLLYTHMTQSSLFAPSLIRRTLKESISLFPYNTMFLQLFAFLERRFRVDDRIRSTVQELLAPRPSTAMTAARLDDKSLVLHYFAIDNEIKRAVNQTSNVHAVRSAFERAVRSEVGQKNAGLWKWYCMYECKNDEKERALAVFYRAIAACPWVKELHMLAFGPLEKYMSLAELKGVYDTMVDRDIRLLLPLDETIDKLSAQSSSHIT